MSPKRIINRPSPQRWILTFVVFSEKAVQLQEQVLRILQRHELFVSQVTKLFDLDDVSKEEPVAFDIVFSGVEKPVQARTSTFLQILAADIKKLMAEHESDYLMQRHLLGERRKKILICDMDGTMIENETLDELSVLAGVGKEVRAITRLGMDGELDFEISLRQRVRLLRGHSASLITKVIKKIRLRRGARTLVATMRDRGGACAILVSGGFRPLTTHIAEELGCTREVANTFELVNGKFTGELLPPLSLTETKREVLEAACTEMACSPQAALAVGDGANDLAMIKKAGLGVLFHPSASLLATRNFSQEGKGGAADTEREHVMPTWPLIRVHGLETLLYFQGYLRSEWQKVD